MEPHPLNQGFEWHDHAGPYRRLGAAQVREFDERGCTVLEDALSPTELARLIAEIDPHEEKVEAFLRTRPDERFAISRAREITFTTHLVARSELARAFCSGLLFQDLCHDLLGPDVRLYWDQAVYKKPGTVEPFPWHQDNGYAYVEPQQYLTCWVALTDATEQNGCPMVVPGIHRGGTLAHRATDLGYVCFDDPPDAPIPVPLRAGSIAIFSSLTPHATGPNTSDGIRKAYIVQFAPDGAQIVNGLHPGPANVPERQFPVLVGGRAPA